MKIKLRCYALHWTLLGLVVTSTAPMVAAESYARVCVTSVDADSRDRCSGGIRCPLREKRFESAATYSPHKPPQPCKHCAASARRRNWAGSSPVLLIVAH